MRVFFAPAGYVADGITSDGWNAYEKGQVRKAFARIEAVADLDFVETGNPVRADLVLVLDTDGEFSALGYFNPPGTRNEGVGVFNGDAWDREPGGSLEVGGFDFVTIVHELLHGLGLAHPHDTGGTSTVLPGVSDPFGDAGAYGLNQGLYTTMTYNSGYLTGPVGRAGHGGGDWGYEAGPMALDIAVLQEKYGANETHNSGANTYRLPGSNQSGTYWESIWDTGGQDTIRYDGSRNAVIDLRAATLEDEKGGGGFVSAANGIAGGFTIANGVVIERGVGGRGNDTIRGNTADNDLLGRGADDRIRGDLGDDTLVGGWGDDTLLGHKDDDTLEGDDGRDELHGGRGSDFLKGNRNADQLFGDNGKDTLWGGDGSDLIEGGRHDDSLVGGNGQDTLRGRHGDDDLSGKRHDDRVTGQDGRDHVKGGGEDDRLGGGHGADTLVGGWGDDTLLGHKDDDTLEGDDGRDELHGGRGSDFLKGNRNADQLFGENGKDTLWGGNGADRLDGGRHDDSLVGGDGADTFVFREGGDTDRVKDFDTDEDELLIQNDLWGSADTPKEVVDTFATVTAAGVVFDFGEGDVLILEGLASTSGLDDAIDPIG
ncbi:M10 family metallopeptidase C-terminal domain-containing protein [Roseovarius salinarum]|uniref:M10 family metallopeptidase C-terminal domain-containing protein n=1 Tax=Roseovarius salinarum TaxID=1981892 RepID=UPI00130014D6|nr:M10 family metallopeptidase C-terminal domain-containing protein [Roseovarius salinarum]